MQVNAIQPGTAQTTTTLPIGMIAGVMSSSQLSSVDTALSARMLRINCGTPLTNDPLAQNLTSQGWPTIVGSQSDAIVPLNSQLAGATSNTTLSYAAAIHSPGAAQLGFLGPTELDTASGVPPMILQLLNTSVSDATTFHALP